MSEIQSAAESPSDPEMETTQLWEHLTEHLDRFSAAWDAATSPPEIKDFLPSSPATLRHLTLIELIKIDLERRWGNDAWQKPLEKYRDEFPELCPAGELPVDLVYEEQQIRKQHGEVVADVANAQRFPGHAALINALDNARTMTASSAVRRRRTAELAPGTNLDEFELLSVLGRGAFGSVYLALQRSLGRILALKVTYDEGFETQTLAQLDHPHIVRVYDQRLLNERHLHLMYMQWVPGGSLQNLVQRVNKTPLAERRGKLILDSVDEQRGRFADVPTGDPRTREFLAELSWPCAVAWLGARLASALEHAHARGVLHRDIKPANVLLAADGSPQLADFNISSCGSVPGSTAEACFGGSLGYMSPEQLDIYLKRTKFSSTSIDSRSDLFSLGVVMWELMAGSRPFHDSRLVEFSPKSLDQLAATRAAGVLETDWKLLPSNCPRGLVVALRRCLEPQRERRIGTAAELRRILDLSRWPQSFDLLHPEPTPVWNWIGRHPLPLLVVCGIVPNAVAAILNIAYNRYENLRQLNSPRVIEIFHWQIIVVNPFAFAIGTIAVVMFLAPLLRAVQDQALGRPLDDSRRTLALQRSLLGGDFTARVSGVEWLVSSLVLPLWLHLAADLPQFGPTQYVQWFFSQTVCGLIGVTLAFFGITLYSLRCLTPRLIDAQRDSPQFAESLERLAERTNWYSRLSFGVVPLALVAMAIVQAESPWTFKILGGVGLVTWALSVALAARIQQIIRDLQVVSKLDAQTRNYRAGS